MERVEGQQEAVRKVFKCVAGVLNNAFGPEEASRCEAEVKLLLDAELEAGTSFASWTSVCQALAKAIDHGLVPEKGVETLKNLGPEKNALTSETSLVTSLGLGAMNVNVVNMAGESNTFKLQPQERILDLKLRLKVPFGARPRLTLGDQSLDDSLTLSAAGLSEGCTVLLAVEKVQWEEEQKSALKDLLNFLEDGEEVQAVVFGDWGWGNYEDVGSVPKERRGKVLSPHEVQCYMEAWSFFGGHGSPECYAAYIYTDRRLIFPSQYDGSTNLEGMPLRPTECMPTMPGQ